jgi:hypothetical protein
MALTPQSLSPEVRGRAFVAGNGELGIALRDIEAFLASCEGDGLAILGWEAWLVDHADGPKIGPRRAVGEWTGLIPATTGTWPTVIGDETDGTRTDESWPEFVRRSVLAARAQISEVEWEKEVAAEWREFLRVNFTMVAQSD